MLRKNVKRGQLAVPWEQADFTPTPPNKALQIDFRWFIIEASKKPQLLPLELI